MRRISLIAILAGLIAAQTLAAPPEVKPSFDLRLRWEGFDTPARNAGTDPEYDLGLARLRAGLDLVWTRWTLHGMVQAGGVFNIPENGAFGAGRERQANQFGLARLPHPFFDCGRRGEGPGKPAGLSSAAAGDFAGRQGGNCGRPARSPCPAPGGSR